MKYYQVFIKSYYRVCKNILGRDQTLALDVVFRCSKQMTSNGQHTDQDEVTFVGEISKRRQINRDANLPQSRELVKPYPISLSAKTSPGGKHFQKSWKLLPSR